MKKISVIMPVYNAEKYLQISMDSILNQSLREIEVICVDDGSTDNSYNILLQYQSRDDRVIVLQQSNQYAGVARNTGMKIAKGEYLCFLDADDFFEDNMLQRLYEKAKISNSDIIICDAYHYNDKTGEIMEDVGIVSKKYLNMAGTLSYKMIPEHIFQVTSPVPWNKIFKREFVQRYHLKFQSTRKSNDEYFVNIALIYADKIDFIDERLIYYRVNNAKSLQGMGEEPSFDFFDALKAIKNELIKAGIYDSVERSFINKGLSICISMLRKQKNLKNFIQIYECIKQEVFIWLNIPEREKEFFYANYHEVQDILMLEPEEYIYEKLLLSREAGCHKIPYKSVGKARKIILYGAGKVGREYMREIIKSDYYSLVAWVDRNYFHYTDRYPKITDPEKVNELDFDKLIIAIANEQTRIEVRNYLVKQGIEGEKIVHELI
ncbi:MAG: glycosyltransferase [Acetatifactor sp.]|nr:glycosyltransferase [Acetatifactor sp.]